MSFWPHIIRRNGSRPVGKGGNLVIPASGWQKKLIQQWVSDMCELTGEGKAEIYKRVLTERAVPVDGKEGDRIENVIADADDQDGTDPYPEKRGIGRGVEEAFDDLSAELDSGYPFDGVGLPYLRMMMTISRNRQLKIHPPIAKDDPRVNLNWYGEHQVIRPIEKAGRPIPNEVRAAFKYDGAPAVYPVFQFVLRNWDLLASKETFSFLTYLSAATENWDDSPQERAMFTNASVQAHNARKQWEEEQSALAEKHYRDSVLVCYAMANGDYVKAPGGWRVVDPDTSAKCTHAGVVEVRNGERFSVPHFLFFLPYPINKMTKADKERIIQGANSVWPEGSISEIEDAKVNIKYGADGGILNYDEYLLAPQIGFFEIPDADTQQGINPPTNAEVIRARKEGNTYSGA